MSLTRADINRGYTDSRWNGFGYLLPRERATSAAVRSAADQAVLRLANRRRWTYDDLFENILDNRVGRIYGEWAMDERRSDAQLDTVLEQGEKELELTPGAHSSFGPLEGPNPPLRSYTDTQGTRAERQFQLARDVSEAARKDEAIRARAPFLYGRSRHRGFTLMQRSTRARYRKRRG
jgi:hypothetical protein